MPSEPRPLWDARETALLLVGFQNDKFSAEGCLRGMIETPERIDAAFAATMQLIREVVELPLQIFSTPLVFDFPTAPSKPTIRPRGMLAAIQETGALKYGTWGASLVPELEVLGDRVTTVGNRQGYNAFDETELGSMLLAGGVRRLLISGMSTSMCIDATGRAAVERGFDVVILSDCIVGRTAVEDSTYCATVFPLYAETVTSTEALERLRGPAVA